MKKHFFALFALLALCLWANVAKADITYSIFDESTGSLTFYYYPGPENNIPNSHLNNPYYYHTGDNFNRGWDSYSTKIKRIVFDKSIANGNVKTIKNIFHDLPNLVEVSGLGYASSANTDVRSLSGLFANCTSLETIDLSAFVSTAITEMNSMFSGCSKLKWVDISGFTAENVTTMEKMFYGCNKLEAVFVSSSFTTKKVTKSNFMFYNNTYLRGKITYNSSNAKDKTYANTNGYFILKPSGNEAYLYYCESNPGVATFCYDNHRSTYGTLLNNNYKNPGWLSLIPKFTKVVFLESLKNVYPTTCYRWFDGGANITTITGVENLNLTKVKYYDKMFKGCSNLTSVTIKNGRTEVSTSEMFRNCTSLTSVSVFAKGDAQYMFAGCTALTSLDVNYISPEITNASHLFDGCTSLKTINGTSKTFNSCTDMSYMFSNCTALTSLPRINAPKVENLSYMFYGCKALTSLTFDSDFSTANVTNISYMFYNCAKLKTIYSNDWNKAKITSQNNCFTGCSVLKGGKGTVYSSSMATGEYAKVDNTNSKGYFTPYSSKITYTLNGGTATNPTTYNIDNSYTIAKPTRTGYVFEGWTGTGLSSKTTNLTIAKGRTYDRAYTANWLYDLSSTSNTVSVSLSSTKYTGSNINVIVKAGNTTLTKGTHYTLIVNGTTDGTIKNKGSYNIEIQGIASNGYTKTKKVTLTVAQAKLTLSAVAQSKTYGESDPTLKYTNQGLLSSDKITTCTMTRATGENVGTDTVSLSTVKITNGSTDVTSNYEIKKETATFTITPKAITVTPDALSKTYGSSDPALTYKTTGMKSGDKLSGSLTRIKGENVGSYSIDCSQLNNSNYKITAVSAKFTINPKPITVTPTVTTKFYSDPDPEITYSAEGLLNSDKLSGKIARTSGETVGEYDFVNNLTNSNYTISLADLKFTIAQKTVTPSIILESDVAVYTGKELKPAVKLMDGTNEIPQSEYTVMYSNNINKGEASVRVENMSGGNYIVNPTNAKFTIVDQDQAYKVTYITNGHGPETKVVYVVKNSLLTLPPDLIAEGYTLKGVFKDKGLNQEWNFATDKVTSETTLYVKWEINSHTISFLVDGSPISSATLEYGAEVVAPTPSKTGYTFVWDEDVPATMPDKDLVINGSYTINTHRLVYKLNGEEYNAEDVTFGTALTLLDSPAARDGYTFSGWSDLPATMPDNDVEIVGSFVPNPHTVTFKIDGKVLSTANTAFGENTADILPKKPGYRFVPDNEMPAQMPDNDLVISGKWEIRTYTLRFMVDGKEYKKSELHYGDKITLIANPSKTGFTFSGWSQAPETMPDNEVSISGSFKVNQHTVTYYIDGEVFKTVTLGYGDRIYAPSAPYKSGLKFSGWGDIPEKMPDNDLEIRGTFSGTTPVAEINTDSNTTKVWAYNHTVYIETAPDTKYKIIDLQGRVLTTSTTKSSHEEIQISHSGIVIVLAGNKSFKVSVR